MRFSKRWLALHVAVAAVGTVISALAYFLAIRADDERVGQLIRFRAEWRATDLAMKFQQPAKSVQAVATAFSVIDDRAIYSFDKDLINRFRALGAARSYLWIPKVTVGERAAFERAMRLGGASDFSILWTDGAEQQMRAAARDEYFPIARGWTFGGPPIPLGFDYLSNPTRAAAVAAARDDGMTVLADPVMSVSTLTPALAFISPVYRGGRIPGTVQERRDLLRGVVSAGVPLTALLNDAIVNTPPISEEIYIADIVAANAPSPLVRPFAWYSPVAGQFEVAVAPVDPGAFPGHTVTLPITVLNQRWISIFHFPPDLIAELERPYLWGWLAGGLLVTALILLVVNLEMRQTARAERTVRARTMELTSANEVLRSENLARQSAERALAESVEFQRMVLNSTQDAVVAIDRHGDITEFNQMAEKLFGYPRTEALGRNVKFLMPEPNRSQHDSYLKSYFVTGIAKIIGAGREVVGARRDGTQFPLELRVNEMQAGSAHGFVGTMRDLTQQKATAAQLAQAQKMEAVGQLTGGMAHDFNNLLGVIVGNLDLVADRMKADPRAREMVDAALGGALQGAELVKKLLAFSRHQPLEPTVVDLNARLPEVVTLLKRTLGENITIETVLGANLWPVLVDPTQVDSAILNLAINARDAMPRGGALTIETANRHLDAQYAALNTDVAAGDYVMIAVSDTGTGMPPEVVARAFDPFFTTKAEGKGTGLGLAMVYGFAKQSGGHVSIYSEVGHGTTVRLYFPAAKAAAASQPEIRADDGLQGGDETVLVVEDREDLRAIAVTALHRLGYRTLEANTAATALALIQGGAKPDLLFSDIVMPGGMSGLDLVQELRSLGIDIPVLITSGYASPQILRDQAQKLGLPTIGKPYRIAELAAKLRAALSRKK
ncbi:MAG: CHASE domain-containing protein [Alphaproteobacteria bacterium]